MFHLLGDYTNNVSYPVKFEYDKFYVYDKGVVVVDGMVICDHDERDTKRETWHTLGYTVDQRVDWDGYNAQVTAYQAEDERLRRKFQKDLAHHFGLAHHPKVDILFNKAWERGHSGGYAEVYNVYSDLCELLE